jgi:hypothetical protein
MNDDAQKSADNFEQFWKKYLLDHAESGTRELHFLGTVIAISAFIIGLITFSPLIAALGIGVGYSLAWSGHLLIEGNRPTMLRHPLWSLLCDLRMFRHWLVGRLDAQLQEAGVAIEEPRQAITTEKPHGGFADRPSTCDG